MARRPLGSALRLSLTIGSEPYPQNCVLDTIARAQKSEIRNSKFETNPKSETKKTPMKLPHSQELCS